MCDIIFLTECWMSVSPQVPNLPGYVTYHTKKHFNQNDGIVIYVRSSLDCSVSESDIIQEANCMVCKIGSLYTLIAIYRPPSFKDPDIFVDSLNDLLLTLKSSNIIHLMGDINIIINNNLDKNITQEYLNMLASHCLLSTHTYATRLENCLDHVFIKSNLQNTTLVLESTITDHFPIVVCLELTGIPHTISKNRTYTDYNAIRSDIQQIDFSPVLRSNDVNFSTNFLVSHVTSIISKHTSTQRIPRTKRNIKPWITPGIIRCIRNRDKLHKQLKSNPNNIIIKMTYSRYRNFINKLLKKLKRAYHNEQLRNAKNNPKATWDIIKNINHLNSSSLSAQALLHTNLDPLTSINSVNQYFTNIGKELTDSIIQSPLRQILDTHPLTSTCDSLVLLDVDEEDIDHLISNLRDGCAVGWDGIATTLLKSLRVVFVPLITHICHLSLTTGIFPDAFKKALVLPIHKGGDRDCVSNYRPISILPTMSKILERVLNNRLVQFLHAKNIIADNQYGFRSGISTEDAVSSLSDHIVGCLDNKQKCLGIFLDLAKAFDTVSIPHLLRKLELLGVRGIALKLFMSYLTNRTQAVKINDLVSNTDSLSFGVPQGSILGPILFSIYINDLCFLKIPHCKIIVYTDDTVLLVSGPNWAYDLSQL